MSVLRVLYKVVERTLHSRISKTIHEDQRGFLKNNSTTVAILKFTQEFYCALKSNEHLISVLLDFNKAFDTISDNILLNQNWK